MFDSVTPDPGNEGLSRAARIFIVIAVLGAIGTVLQLLTVVSTPTAEAVITALLAGVSSVLAYITAKGIEAQRPWAKRLAYVQGALLLLNFPIGTLIGIFVLVYVYRASRAGLFAPAAQS